MRADVADALLWLSQPEQRRTPVNPEIAGDGDKALLDAAIDLQVGNAKAALARLEPVTGPAADAMCVAAIALDRNWYPGDLGAILDDGFAEWMREPPDLTGDAATDAIVVAYSRVAAMTRTWRSIATSFGRFGRADRFLADVAPTIEQLRTGVDSAGLAPLAQHLALVLADLHHRAGTGQGETWWSDALHRAESAGDVAAVGNCHVVRGDWCCGAARSPELLGFDLETPAAPRPPADIPGARAHYQRATESFDAVGGARGAAALALRSAFLVREAGDVQAWSEAAVGALELARSGGDVALTHLAGVHAQLAAIAAGQLATAEGSVIVEWATGPGSTSYGQGLTRLCLAQAGAWRLEGELVAARRALRLASELGAAVDPAVISRELTELHRQYFPLAAVVVALGDLDRALARAVTPSPLEWAALADRAMAVHAAAVDRRDPEAIAAGARRMRDVLAKAPTVPAATTPLGPMTEEEMAAATRDALTSTIADTDVLVPLYAAAAARLRGRAGEAARHLADAEAAARARGPGGRLMLAVVLGTADRNAEAVPIVDALVADGVLAADHTVELYLRLGQHERAAEIAATAPAAPGWEGLAQRAELAEQRGDSATAITLVREAIEDFERRILRFGRDSLKSAATDDPAAAGMYLTAVRALLVGGADDDVAHAFAVSDRCRSLAATDLVAFVDDAPGVRGTTGAALRGWRRAESRWAATFEELSEQVGDPPAASDTRTVERLAAAEVELDDAEVELERRVPGVLAARREPPPWLDSTAVAAVLPDDAVLVQYHAYDDDLVVWALTGEHLAVGRRTVGWRELASMARCFLDDASGVGAHYEAGELATLLLDPVADAVREHRRLVIVPYGGLAALPFQLLPFDGGLLADDRVLSYLPAASLATARAGCGVPRLGAGALVVGNPAYAAGRGLRPLPGAEVEASAVASVLSGGVELLVGAAATEDAVAAAVRHRPILHLATHGLLSERSPNRSAVALAGDDELTVGDLVGLDLDTDLVVLSACDTGRGTTTLGGDVIGLVRAVLAAGARNVVVSQWPVDDRAGCVLMVSFYERLLAGDDVATALAAAARSVRELEGPALVEAYEAVGGNTDPAVAGPVRRDLPGSPEPRPDSTTSRWAPFIHIGL